MIISVDSLMVKFLKEQLAEAECTCEDDDTEDYYAGFSDDIDPCSVCVE